MTNKEFNETISAKDIAVVKFGATWCAPCKAMEPIIKEIATEYQNKAVVMSIDVEDEPDVATNMKIRNVPTTIFYKNGVQVDKIVGSASKDAIVKKMNQI